MGDRVLVTGADGLLGSYVVRELLASGTDVRAMVEPGAKSPTLTGLDVEIVSGDLLSGNGIADAARGCRFVFHCAATTNLWAPEKIVWAINDEGTRRVLDACEAAKVERLVFVGSASSFAFGTIDRPGDETGPFPAFYRGVPYMESKHAAVDRVRERVRAGRVNAVIAAPTFMLGEYDARPSSGELIRQFVRRRMRRVSPGGRNFSHARNVAAALVSAATRGASGETYIVGGANVTYLDFFARVARAVGLPEPVGVLPGPVIRVAGLLGSAAGALLRRPVPLNRTTARLACVGTYYSSARAERDLGLAASDVDEAIADSVRGLKKYGHLD